MKNNKGFSLVELIVVIAIMAILAAVAIPTFATFINKANVASDVSFVNDLEYAAQLAHSATGDKVTDVQVVVDANGNVTGATYKVGTDVTVTITKGNDGNYTATAVKGSDTMTAIATAADDTIKAVDWTYKFKSTSAADNYAVEDNKLIQK